MDMDREDFAMIVEIACGIEVRNVGWINHYKSNNVMVFSARLVVGDGESLIYSMVFESPEASMPIAKLFEVISTALYHKFRDRDEDEE